MPVIIYPYISISQCQASGLISLRFAPFSFVKILSYSHSYSALPASLIVHHPLSVNHQSTMICHHLLHFTIHQSTQPIILHPLLLITMPFTHHLLHVPSIMHHHALLPINQSLTQSLYPFITIYNQWCLSIHILHSSLTTHHPFTCFIVIHSFMSLILIMSSFIHHSHSLHHNLWSCVPWSVSCNSCHSFIHLISHASLTIQSTFTITHSPCIMSCRTYSLIHHHPFVDAVIDSLIHWPSSRHPSVTLTLTPMHVSPFTTITDHSPPTATHHITSPPIITSCPAMLYYQSISQSLHIIHHQSSSIVIDHYHARMQYIITLASSSHSIINQCNQSTVIAHHSQYIISSVASLSFIFVTSHHMTLNSWSLVHATPPSFLASHQYMHPSSSTIHPSVIIHPSVPIQPTIIPHHSSIRHLHSSSMSSDMHASFDHVHRAIPPDITRLPRIHPSTRSIAIRSTPRVFVVGASQMTEWVRAPYNSGYPW